MYPHETVPSSRWLSSTTGPATVQERPPSVDARVGARTPALRLSKQQLLQLIDALDFDEQLGKQAGCDEVVPGDPPVTVSVAEGAGPEGFGLYGYVGTTTPDASDLVYLGPLNARPASDL